MAGAQEVQQANERKYLKDYITGDLLFIVDNRIVAQDSLPLLIKAEDVEKVELHGRPRHLNPDLKYKLNGKPISADEAGNIVVADI